MENIKFIGFTDYTDYIADQTVNISIPSVPNTDSDTITDVPLEPDTAIEVEFEGRRFVLLGYEKKS